LRHNHYIREVVNLQPLPQFDVLLHPAAPRIQQEDGQPHSLPVQEISLDKLFPRPRYFLGNFGEAISGQVYEAVAAVDLEEIDQLRSTRPGTRTCQPVGTQKRIQETGFSNVASPQERDLRFRLRWKLLGSGCTYYKPGRHIPGWTPIPAAFTVPGLTSVCDFL